MQPLAIVGARVWLGQDKGWQVADVLCRDGHIESVGAGLGKTQARVIDARGLWLIPGVIDPQVHFRDPGAIYKEDLHTGSIACAAGGVTTFFDMPNTAPPATSPELVAQKQMLAAEKSLVNFAFFIGATCDNLSDLNAAKGVCGIKVFMGSSTGTLLVDDQAALERIFGETDPARVIALHCEDETRIRERSKTFADRNDVAAHSLVRDNETARIATARAMDLAVRHRHRAHILHVSTAEECLLLRQRAAWVTAECTPHHMLFCNEDYARLGARLKVNPPVKSRADSEALWAALKDGSIDLIATDHAPHSLEEKGRALLKEIPSGLPSIENSLGLMLDAARQKRCTLEQVIHWMCEAPARIYGLTRKGCIAPGYDADLTLVDPTKRHVVLDEQQFSKCRWSPWHGQSFTGWPVTTIVGGKIAFENGKPNLDCRGVNVF